MKKTEVWGQESCSYCKKACEILEQYGIEYEYIDAQANHMMFACLFPNAKTVPQIIFQGEHVGGYTDLVNEMDNRNMFIGSQQII